MKTLQNTILSLALVAGLTATVSGQESPSNPCGGKSMNPATATGDPDGRAFEVNDPMGRNSVTFKSTAPLEDIVGTSNQVTGQLFFDPSNPQSGGHGSLTIPVSSLNTGIPMRDEHLAGSDWLNAEANPDITFDIVQLEHVKSVKSTADAQTFDVTAVGDFSLNGITKSLSVPARITYLRESEATKKRLPGDLLAARATFEIKLADFGITGPAGMDLIGSKVGEVVRLELSVMGSAACEVMAGNPCGGKAASASMAGNPCGGKVSSAKSTDNPCGGKKAGNPCGGK